MTHIWVAALFYLNNITVTTTKEVYALQTVAVNDIVYLAVSECGTCPSLDQVIVELCLMPFLLLDVNF